MRFLRHFLAWVALIALLYCGLAVLADPRREFGTGLFPAVVRDARADKVALFETYAKSAPVDGLILGSSRSMKLQPEAFRAGNVQRIFNFGVDSARTEDYLAIYRWAKKQQGGKIKSLVIGLDVEALHDHWAPDSRLLACRPLVRAYGKGIPGAPNLRARVVATVKDLQSSMTIGFVSDVVRAAAAAVRPKSPEELETYFEENGYIQYNGKEKRRAEESYNYEEILQETSAEYTERFKKMTALSKPRKADLQTLLRLAEQDGVQVKVFLTPLHPKVESAIQTKTRYLELIQSAREYLRTLEGLPNVRVYDLSRLETFGATLDGWYDGSHMDTDNSDRAATLLMNDGWK